MVLETLGAIVHSLVPHRLMSKQWLRNWYERNPHHLFYDHDLLILRKRNAPHDYGIRPVIMVLQYNQEKNEKGNYVVALSQDDIGNFQDWVQSNTVIRGVRRTIAQRQFSKYDLEYYFKRVEATHMGKALESYASRETIFNTSSKRR